MAATVSPTTPQIDPNVLRVFHAVFPAAASPAPPQARPKRHDDARQTPQKKHDSRNILSPSKRSKNAAPTLDPAQSSSLSTVPTAPIITELTQAEQIRFSRAWILITAALSHTLLDTDQHHAISLPETFSGDFQWAIEEEKKQAGEWYSRTKSSRRSKTDEDGEIKRAVAYLLAVKIPQQSAVSRGPQSHEDNKKQEGARRRQGWGSSRGQVEGVMDMDEQGQTDADAPMYEDTVPLPIKMLLRWYFETVVLTRWERWERPALEEGLNGLDSLSPEQRLFYMVRYLRRVQSIYLHPLRAHIYPHLPDNGVIRTLEFLRQLHGVTAITLPIQGVEDGLRAFFSHRASVCLDVDRERYPAEDSMQVESEQEASTYSWVSAMQSVGFGGQRAQRVFARVMTCTLESYVRKNFAGRWEPPSQSEDDLRGWIEQSFAPFIALVLKRIQYREISWLELIPDEDLRAGISNEEWLEIAINRLGSLRSEELFDIIIDWGEDVIGAIEDLKLAIKTPMARSYLTTTFIAVLNKRLLQPGASTIQIIQIYISIIRAFNLLDPRGVLLDRVAWPIRRYLRERDDTVSLIVDGLLADPEEYDPATPVEKLVELADELANNAGTLNDADNDGELDFDDMEWMPDPVDAGPDYKKSKNVDVIGSLISLFESRDIFVKQFQKILGERLLWKGYEFDREIRVLELLKLRFGEASLQACEVMLRDVLDSRRVDNAIQHDQRYRAAQQQQARAANNAFAKLKGLPALHTRILSHLFWPSLPSEETAVPPEIAQLQSGYEVAFESMKQDRKLTWLNTLGQATVSLEFDDRSITEQCQTWQASVIYAFQDDTATIPEDLASSGLGAVRTVPDLATKLSMPESMVLRALHFWVTKRVLVGLPEQVYAVLERVALYNSTMNAEADEAGASDRSASPMLVVEDEHAKRKTDIRTTFLPYISGMLTNSGPMALPQIQMMLQIAVPGGFPYSGADLKEVLDDEIDEAGALEYASGMYRVRK